MSARCIPTRLDGELVFTYDYDKENPSKRGVGTYNIYITGLTSDKYIIIFNNSDGELEIPVGKLVVNPKELVVTPNNHEIVYGEAASNNGLTITGFVYGEDGRSIFCLINSNTKEG